MKKIAAIGLALISCVANPQEIETLARAEVASDYTTYSIRRVGLLPFCGEKMSEEQACALQGAFVSELQRSSTFEIVPLKASDLEEIPDTKPFQKGWVEPRTVIELGRRFQLDAVFVGTVTDRQYFLPQRLGVQLDMISVETGAAIWASSVSLDASNEQVRRGIRTWFDNHKAIGERGETWELCLLSPRRFAEFAAFQITREL